MDDVERVLAVSCDGDATDDLALAVQLGNAAALVRNQFDARNVAQEDRQCPSGSLVRG